MESLTAADLRTSADHQLNDEAIDSCTDDQLAQSVLDSTREVAQEVMLEEQTLDEVTAHVANLLVDSEIKATANEELQSYICQAEATEYIIEGVLYTYIRDLC